MSLKSKEELEYAVQNLIISTQNAARRASPTTGTSNSKHDYPANIRSAVTEKRNLRKEWQRTRNPSDKTLLNRAIKQLKEMLQKQRNEELYNYLSSLSPSAASNHSLWRATKNLKQPKQRKSTLRRSDGTWTRSDKDKSELLDDHLSSVFKPFPSELDDAVENEI